MLLIEALGRLKRDGLEVDLVLIATANCVPK